MIQIFVGSKNEPLCAARLFRAPRLICSVTGVLLFLFLFICCSSEKLPSLESKKPESSAEPAEAREFLFCSKVYPNQEFKRFMNGNLATVSTFIQLTRDHVFMLIKILEGFAEKGFDSRNADAAPIVFSGGSYQLNSLGLSLGFNALFAQDTETYKAGGAIPENLFELASYAQNIVVTVDANSNPIYQFSPGPLSPLLDGKLEISGREPPFDFKVKFKNTQIMFELLASAAVPLKSPDLQIQSDTFKGVEEFVAKISMPAKKLSEISDTLRGGSLGISVDGSTVTSVFYGMTKTLSESTLIISKDSNGVLTFEGQFVTDTKSQTPAMNHFEFSTISDSSLSRTAVFCDRTREQETGVATHFRDLTGGNFKFATGADLEYGYLLQR